MAGIILLGFELLAMLVCFRTLHEAFLPQETPRDRMLAIRLGPLVQENSEYAGEPWQHEYIRPLAADDPWYDNEPRHPGFLVWKWSEEDPDFGLSRSAVALCNFYPQVREEEKHLGLVD